ncbi:MAG: glycine--tRNA ligase [Candidatus Andersenbacteria bacterium]|nr:glycine--tRNA ligase [Candidatus Andersenbacteria bacterium]MBI3250995.1 glycine--tRNA ligase [Candidatus Andersenbacteria bacterium]
MPTMDTIVNLAKRRGFIFPGSEIYGGLANSWDYGPLGVELKNNIKRLWWKHFVHARLDMVGIDAALMMNPRVWEASGHVETFHDPLVECKSCHARFRADHVDTAKPCQNCGKKGTFTDPANFNLMFKTHLGPKQEDATTVYLRPETAQAMFVDFLNVAQTSRRRIPFGIAQVGKAFRNEIAPGNFIFRTREFEQMEIEYFIPPKGWEEHFETWLKAMHNWIKLCGIKTELIHEFEVPKDELAHYSKRTVDIQFDFPFGQEELYGLAYRTDFDLKRHAEFSGKDMTYTDPISNEKYIPHVVEPTFGVDRTLLALLVSAYTEEDAPTASGDSEKRIVMKFPPYLAPYQVAVLPLSKKPELEEVARKLALDLAQKWSVDYDVTQSIGRRYRRQDEIGTPWCVTVDFDSLNDNQATIRDRDTMKQERIAIQDIPQYIQEKL